MRESKIDLTGGQGTLLLMEIVTLATWPQSANVLSTISRTYITGVDNR